MPSAAVPHLRLTLRLHVRTDNIYIYIYISADADKISDDADKEGFAKGGWGLQAHIGEKLLLALARPGSQISGNDKSTYIQWPLWWKITLITFHNSQIFFNFFRIAFAISSYGGCSVVTHSSQFSCHAFQKTRVAAGTASRHADAKLGTCSVVTHSSQLSRIPKNFRWLTHTHLQATSRGPPHTRACRHT